MQLGDLDEDEMDDELDDFKNYSLVSDFSDIGNIEMLEAARQVAAMHKGMSDPRSRT